jgi:hypothetical protein
MAANQLCGNFCEKEVQPAEWHQHCSAKWHHEVCVNLRPRPQNHPCCGSHHKKSQCQYRANQGKRLIGPETVTTKNSHARRQLSRPPMEEFIESIKNLFDEEDDYLEAIKNLFDEEEEREAAQRDEPIVEQPHAHVWWEGFKASPYPRVRSQGMTN